MVLEVIAYVFLVSSQTAANRNPSVSWVCLAVGCGSKNTKLLDPRLILPNSTSMTGILDSFWKCYLMKNDFEDPVRTKT